ncbi:flavodoxin [Treponema sp.]|uniref:flavodoxin n=1 Tax=Treponema sp. TaxID=166 RepID=UPI003F0844FB
MKKLVFAILIGGLFMANVNAKTLVAYFSATGNTKRLSQTVASALGADIVEIEPKVPYTSSDLDWTDKKSRSTVECNDPSARSEIKNKIAVSPYDTVIIAFPIWWYNAPKIIYTFVESVDLSGKKVVPICTSGGSGLGRTPADLQKVGSKTADWRKGTRFSSSASASEVKKYFDEVLK